MAKKSLGDAMGSAFGSVATAADTIGTIFETVQSLAESGKDGVQLLSTSIAVAQINADEWKRLTQATATSSTDQRIQEIQIERARTTAKLLAEVERECAADPEFNKYYRAAMGLAQPSAEATVTQLHAAE